MENRREVPYSVKSKILEEIQDLIEKKAFPIKGGYNEIVKILNPPIRHTHYTKYTTHYKWEEIINICKLHTTSSVSNFFSKQSILGSGGRDPMADLIYKAMANFDENYTASNGKIDSLADLLNTQQKRDALEKCNSINNLVTIIGKTETGQFDQYRFKQKHGQFKGDIVLVYLPGSSNSVPDDLPTPFEGYVRMCTKDGKDEKLVQVHKGINGLKYTTITDMLQQFDEEMRTAYGTIELSEHIKAHVKQPDISLHELLQGNQFLVRSHWPEAKNDIPEGKSIVFTYEREADFVALHPNSDGTLPPPPDNFQSGFVRIYNEDAAHNQLYFLDKERPSDIIRMEVDRKQLDQFDQIVVEHFDENGQPVVGAISEDQLREIELATGSLKHIIKNAFFAHYIKDEKLEHKQLELSEVPITVQKKCHEITGTFKKAQHPEKDSESILELDMSSKEKRKYDQIADKCFSNGLSSKHRFSISDSKLLNHPIIKQMTQLGDKLFSLLKSAEKEVKKVRTPTPQQKSPQKELQQVTDYGRRRK